MQTAALYRTCKIIGYAVIVLGGAAICYSTAIAILHWSGIGV